MAKDTPHEAWFRLAESIFDEHDGRPHWGKLHYQSAATLAVLPVQTHLVYRVGKHHGYTLDAGHVKEFLGVLGLGLASQAVEVGGQAVRYTISAGIATMDADVSDFDALMQRADEALYAAKAGGRNRVERWQPALQSAAVR